MRVLVLLSVICLPFPVFPQASDFEGFDFSKPDSVAQIYNNFDLHQEEKLVQLLTKDFSTDIEKFRAIFKWITNNISYDLDLYNESKEKTRELRYNKQKLERWQQSFHKKVMRKLFNQKSSICSGYASLLESMCDLAGITSEVISGYARTNNLAIGTGSIDHAWNAVYLGNRWFFSDPTWASGYVDDEFRRKFNRQYFIATPEQFVIDHYPKNKDWLMLQNPMSSRDFLNSPHKASGFYINKINQFNPLSGKLKLDNDSILNFSFTSNLPIDSVTSVTAVTYKLGKRSYLFEDQKIILLDRNKEGYFVFKVKLNENGYYRLRFFVRHHLTLTYEVKVSGLIRKSQRR